MSEQLNYALDAVSLAVVLSVFAEILPSIAALLTIIWTGVRVYEWYLFRFVLKKQKPFH